jgi:hypothetical protein
MPLPPNAISARFMFSAQVSPPPSSSSAGPPTRPGKVNTEAKSLRVTVGAEESHEVRVQQLEAWLEGKRKSASGDH